MTSNSPSTEDSSTANTTQKQEEKRQALLKIYSSLISKEESRTQIPCLETIYKILNNLLQHPDEKKYCQIRFSSQTFQKVLTVKGGLDFLYELGFKRKVFEFQEYLVFEPSQDPYWKSIFTVACDLILEKKKTLEERRTEAERHAKLVEQEEKRYRHQILQQIEDDKQSRKMKFLVVGKK
jgi:hypothetical protein